MKGVSGDAWIGHLFIHKTNENIEKIGDLLH